MRRSLLILTVVSLMLSFQAQAKPAATPKELGERFAQALLSGNTNLAASCLLPMEAYAPMAIDPDGKLTPKQVSQYHALWGSRLDILHCGWRGGLGLGKYPSWQEHCESMLRVGGAM
jgi:hypothetical protein